MEFKFNHKLSEDEIARLNGMGESPMVLAQINPFYQVRHEMRGPSADHYVLSVVFVFDEIAVPLWEKDFGSVYECFDDVDFALFLEEAVGVMMALVKIEAKYPDEMRETLLQFRDQLVSEQFALMGPDKAQKIMDRWGRQQARFAAYAKERAAQLLLERILA